MSDRFTLSKQPATPVPGPLTLRRHLLALVQAPSVSSEIHVQDRWEEASKACRAGSAFFHDLIAAIQAGLTLEGVVALAQLGAVESTKHEAMCRAEARSAWQLWLDEYAVLRAREPHDHPPVEAMDEAGIIRAVLAAGEDGTAGAALLTEPPTIDRREREFHATGGESREH